jgi:UDP-N-acetylmuramyl tripeptide synthase
MKLRELLATVDNVVQLPQHPAMDTEIKNLKTDSHACVAGDLFIGMPVVPGIRVDGGDFWQSAIARSGWLILLPLIEDQFINTVTDSERTLPLNH